MHLLLLQDAIKSLLSTAKALLVANIIVALFLVLDLYFRVREWNAKYGLSEKIVSAAKKASESIRKKIEDFKLKPIFNRKKEIADIAEAENENIGRDQAE